MKPVNDAPPGELSPDDLKALLDAQAANRKRLSLPAETAAPVRRAPLSLVPSLVPGRVDGLLPKNIPVAPMGDDVRIINRVVHQRRTCACGVTWWRARTSPNEACDACTERERLEQRARRHAAAVERMPPKFQGVTFATSWLVRLVGQARIDTGRAVSTFDGSSLVLILGSTGLGKTSLASAIYRAQVDRLLAPGATVTDEAWVGRMVWTHAKPLSLARKESRLGATPRQLEQAADASVLLLDDLGQESLADKDDLVDLLTFREANLLPTILTFGFTLDHLEERYGAHLARRLIEDKAVIDLGSGK